MIYCGGECQLIIRTLTFKPFTLRQKLQSGALQSWFSSRVYQHDSLFTACDSLTPWWTAAFVKPVKQTLLLSMQIHGGGTSLKSQIIMAPALVKTNSTQLSQGCLDYNIICTQKQQNTLVCQWETSTFCTTVSTCQCECLTQCLESKQITANNTRATAWKKGHKYQLGLFSGFHLWNQTLICHVTRVKCMSLQIQTKSLFYVFI